MGTTMWGLIIEQIFSENGGCLRILGEEEDQIIITFLWYYSCVEKAIFQLSQVHVSRW